MPTPIAAPPRMPTKSAVKAEQRHHQHQRDHARQHEKLERRDPHGREGVDLLGHLHACRAAPRKRRRCGRP